MKAKNELRKLSNLKIFWIMMAVAVVLVAFSYCSKNKTANELQTEKLIAPPPPPPPSPPPPPPSDATEPLKMVEVMPYFQGGDSALLDYIAKNTKYPDSAKDEGISGRVIVRFCVEANGDVGRISVLKGVSPVLDAESMRVVSTLPAFTPGMQDGKEVPVWYVVPITFALK
jgi:TonB family protein